MEELLSKRTYVCKPITGLRNNCKLITGLRNNCKLILGRVKHRVKPYEWKKPYGNILSLKIITHSLTHYKKSPRSITLRGSITIKSKLYLTHFLFSLRLKYLY